VSSQKNGLITLQLKKLTYFSRSYTFLPNPLTTKAMKRRNFLGSSLLGVPALALPGTAKALDFTNPALLPPDDAFTLERKRLINEANFGKKKGVSSSKGIAVSSNPLVSNEAIKVLKAGGNAADAALAASIVQTVVEPHMTTLTGVFSMLYYDAKTGKTKYVNGSCNAPLATKKEEFAPQKLMGLVPTGKSVIVPGFWGGFEESHKQFATLPIKQLMKNAIRYANEGFEAYPFLWGEIFDSADNIAASADGKEIYFQGNDLIRPGGMVIQKKLGAVLARLSEEGSKYFYHGEFARNFCKVVQKAGGIVTEADFERYVPMVQDTVKGSFRDYTIEAAPAPDFGGENIIEYMQMAELFDFKKYGPIHSSYESTLKAMQILGEVLVHSMIERVTGNVTPVEKRLSKAYAAERFAKLPGKPLTLSDLMPAKPGSNHLTVVDAQGNVATVLHSVMSLPWTNQLYTDGVSICGAFLHYANGVPDPGQRINARIGPNIFFKNNKPVLASGSPSVSLMENIFQNTINILDFGMLPEESVHYPRFGGSSITKPDSMLIEQNYDPTIVAALEKLGMKFDKVRPWQWHLGSFEGVFIDPKSNIRYACGDPRRAGQAKAQ
jgi:gamma-glutamyltranspeptidase/glutathione hydrolase